MKPERNRDEHILAEAICGLGGIIGQLVRELSQINNNQAVLQSIAELKETIMSVLSEFANRVDAKFTTISDAVDGIVASQTGLTGDVAGLKALIKQLQDSPGGVTPEDQALLDALEAKINTTSDKVTATATALAALDAETEEVPTPTPS